MSNDPEHREKEVALSLEKQLNVHGFSFQYAVAKRAEELRENSEVRWQLEGTEIPVGLGSDLIHIDIVFEQRDRYQHDKTFVYIVAECKRVDPAKASWCFVKSPYTWRFASQTKNSIQLDKINRFEPEETFTGSTLINYSGKGTYELGFELKTTAKGDGIGSHHKTAIDEAVTQVLKGTKGFINYLIDSHETAAERKLSRENTFMPVIFTTADLYTTDSNIALADLSTGKLKPESIEVTKVDWLWFTYNRSLNLAHSIPTNPEANKEYSQYYRDFSRSVAIVSPTGIDTFIKTRFRELFW